MSTHQLITSDEYILGYNDEFALIKTVKKYDELYIHGHLPDIRKYTLVTKYSCFRFESLENKYTQVSSYMRFVHKKEVSLHTNLKLRFRNSKITTFCPLIIIRAANS